MLANTALTAASAPITAIIACGSAMVTSGIEAGPAHRVQAGAVRLAQHDAQLRDGRVGDRRDHLGAVADDPLALDRLADHEAGHVGQEHQRQPERVAQPDEARRLVGGIDEQHAALPLRLAGDDADRAPVQAREAGDDLAREQLLELEEAPVVDQRVDDVVDVERLILVGGKDVVDPLRAGGGARGAAAGGGSSPGWGARCGR